MVIKANGEPMLHHIVEFSNRGNFAPCLSAVLSENKGEALFGHHVKDLEILPDSTPAPTLSVEAIAMLHAEIAELRAQVACLRSQLEAK